MHEEDFLINRYLKGELQEEEKDIFEEQMNTDDVFAKKVKMEKGMAQAVRLHDQLSFRDKLQGFEKKIKKTNRQRKYFFGGLGIIIISIITYFMIPSSMNHLEKPITPLDKNESSDNHVDNLIPGESKISPVSLEVTIKHKNVSENGANDGTISVSVIGGVAPYTYLWENGVSTKNRRNLSAGKYSLTLTDTQKRQAFQSVTITEPPAFASESSKLEKKTLAIVDKYLSTPESLPSFTRGNTKEQEWRSAYEARDYHKTLQLLEEIIEENGIGDEVLYYAGHCQLNLTNYSTAVGYFYQIISRESGNFREARWYAALANLKLENQDIEIKLLEELYLPHEEFDDYYHFNEEKAKTLVEQLKNL